MTREETKKLLRIIVASYPTFKPADMEDTINVWHLMLDDQDYRVIAMALKSYIRTSGSGFAPSIGQLMDYAHKITAPEEMTGQEAWGLVMRAVRNGAYNSLQEFAKLPEPIQKAVGSHEQIRSMAIDDNFNENVASSNFQRSYKIIVEREKELQKIDGNVLKMIQQVNEGSPKQLLEESNRQKVERLQNDRLIEQKHGEYVPMPDEVREQLQKILGRM